MTRLVSILLAASVLAVGVATLAPAASAEKMCLTVQDTIYFYLKYYTGSSWAVAHAALSKLGCPGIEGVLCAYGPWICAVPVEDVASLGRAVTGVYEDNGGEPTGDDVDALVGALPRCVRVDGMAPVCAPTTDGRCFGLAGSESFCLA